MNKKYIALLACSILFIVLFSFRNHKISSPASPSFSFPFSADTTSPFIKPKDYKGKSVVSTTGIVTLTTGVENDFYQVDSTNKTVSFYAEIKLAKLLNAATQRIPLNISIVIDRSGSMQGVKMGFAKKAAKTIIDQLQPVDYVSVVMYDNAIDSVQEPVLVSNKDIIREKIDRITPRGATNLWGGTEKGYQFVRRFYKPGYINRVLLISDGLANVGLTDSVQIKKYVQKYKDESGITLSTFGVGLDYNEKLMTDMAETGAGNYYFIDAPGSLVSLFDKELNGLLNVVAQNAVLKIKLPDGVKLEKSYPLKFTQVENTLMIRLLDLFSQETKGTILKFKLDDKISKPLKFTSTLNYMDVLDGKEKLITNENTISPSKTADAYLTHFNKPVIEQNIFFTANENLERAMGEADKGNYDQAKNYLDANANYLKLNAVYVNNSPELKRMDSTNRNYNIALSRAKNLAADSVKKVQKISREESYKLRNKKGSY
jgi:Ca-activated chloride channel family protein